MRKVYGFLILSLGFFSVGNVAFGEGSFSGSHSQFQHSQFSSAQNFQHTQFTNSLSNTQPLTQPVTQNVQNFQSETPGRMAANRAEFQSNLESSSSRFRDSSDSFSNMKMEFTHPDMQHFNFNTQPQ